MLMLGDNFGVPIPIRMIVAIIALSEVLRPCRNRR
jgi:hypothetical protein